MITSIPSVEPTATFLPGESATLSAHGFIPQQYRPSRLLLLAAPPQDRRSSWAPRLLPLATLGVGTSSSAWLTSRPADLLPWKSQTLWKIIPSYAGEARGSGEADGSATCRLVKIKMHSISSSSGQLPNQPTTKNRVLLNPLTHTKGLAEIILVQWFSMQCNCTGSVIKKGSRGGSIVCMGVEKVDSHCSRGPTLSTHFISALDSSSQTPANQVTLEECGTFRFSDQHQQRFKPLAGQLQFSVSTHSMEVCGNEVRRCPCPHSQTCRVKYLNKLDKLGSFKELKKQQ